MIVRRRILTTLRIASILFIVTATGRTGLAEHPSRDDLSARLMDDLADGVLDEFPLFDAALVASGVTTQEGLDYYDQRFNQMCEILPFDSQADSRQRAQGAFTFLHKWILTGSYVSDCTELDRTLKELLDYWRGRV